MNDRLERPVKGSKVLIVGLAYKKNVDDMRESPSIHLIEKFRAKGATVEYYDPFVPKVPDTRGHEHIADMESVDWDAKSLATFDVAVIATNHDGVDYGPLLENVPLVVDTRNALRDVQGDFAKRVLKA